MAIKRDAAFESFVGTAQAMLGNDLSEDWLFEIWVGADADANRALNHVLDSPDDKVKRTSGGHKTSSESKTPKKSKPPKESKPAPATPATTWGDDDYTAPTPPPQQHQAPPQQAPPPQQYGYPQQPGYPQTQPMPYPGQPQQPMGYPQQPMGYPQPPMMQQPTMPQPMMQQPMMSQPMMPQPTFIMDPMTGLPIAPMNPIQQAQTMFVQQQQQQRLMALKMSIDSVLSNPTALTSPQIMQNLQDTMIQALEAPNATLQMAERARQSQQTAHFIHIMQGQIGQMLADPKVATNPALLQQLNTQMNQLRLLTMQHVAQQQLDANPATALSSLSVPMLAPPSPSATLLSRAMLANQARISGMPTMSGNLGLQMLEDDSVAQGVPLVSLPKGDVDEDWWSSTPKSTAKTGLSEKNPFRDNETETTPTSSRRRLGNSSRSLSNPNLLALQAAALGSMPTLTGMPMGNPLMSGALGGMPMSMPMLGQQAPSQPNLAMMYGSQQPGYNPMASAQLNQFMYGPGVYPRQF